MRIRLLLYTLVCVALCGIFTACSDNKTQNIESTAPEIDEMSGGNTAEEFPDSMPESMKTVPEKPEEAKPQLHFASTQDALEYMNNSPHADKYAEGIIPRMAEDELSYATKLLNSDFDKFLIIDKQLMRVGLFDRYGREILSYGIACARNYGTKHKRADSRTPEGFFSVEGIYDSTDWLFTNDNGYTSPVKGQFGPRFIRIKNPVSTQIGLHGTSSPGSIGKRRSHGCIRVKNENILELVGYVTPGMPVIISPSKRDCQVNKKEGYHIPMITMDPFGKYTDSASAQPLESPSKPKTSSESPAGTDTQTPDTLTGEPSAEPQSTVIPAPADTIAG